MVTISEQRTRERYIGYQSGEFTWRFGGNVTGFYFSRERCTDHVPSPEGNLPLFIDRTKTNGGLINGDSGGFLDIKCKNYPVAGRTTWPAIGSPVGRPPNSMLASKMLSRTNPSKPSVDVPAFVGEFLSDGFPALLLQGGSIFKRAGSAYLSGAFGVAPLVRDLLTALNFAKEVEKRFQVLRQFRQNGSKSYRLVLHTDSTSNVTYNVPLETLATYVYADMHEVCQREIAGHMKWFTLNHFPQLDQDLYKIAVKATLGLEANFHAVWQVLPFTWLADWFSNVGDLLNSTRNVCNLFPSEVAIMDHVRKESVSKNITTPIWAKMDPLIARYESKSRDLATASLDASLPILTAGQWSILGALGSAKRL